MSLKIVDFASLTLAGLCLYPLLSGNMICLHEDTNLYPNPMFLTIFGLSFSVWFHPRNTEGKHTVINAKTLSWKTLLFQVTVYIHWGGNKVLVCILLLLCFWIFDMNVWLSLTRKELKDSSLLTSMSLPENSGDIFYLKNQIFKITLVLSEMFYLKSLHNLHNKMIFFFFFFAGTSHL